MPQYRVEVSPNKRAGCKDAICKKESIKIQKGEIRFGTWVEIEERGSWHWKHWGCTSGAILTRLRDMCEEGGGFDPDSAIDGFDEIEDEDVKEKIMRCIKQGHIDAEDFKGDPEKNVPGAVGIRLTAKEIKAMEKAAAGEDEKKPAKKRARKSNADDDDEKPKPTKKSKKVKAEDDEDEKPKPAKPSKKVKKEDDDEVEEPAPKKVAKAKAKPAAKKSKKVKKEESDEEESAESSFDEASDDDDEDDFGDEDDGDDFKPKSRSKSKAKPATGRRRSGRA